jgi:hypothetical protein
VEKIGRVICLKFAAESIKKKKKNFKIVLANLEKKHEQAGCPQNVALKFF